MDHLVAKVTIERRAEALATTHGGPPVDVEAIAAGVGIFDISWGEIDDSAVLLAGPVTGTWGVLLKRSGTLQRRRFSIAHEVGHLVLGIVGTERFYRSRIAARAEQNAEERACDYFAACLLMPRPWVLERAAGDITAAQLARRFGVSVPSMRIRLRELGLNALAAS